MRLPVGEGRLALLESISLFWIHCVTDDSVCFCCPKNRFRAYIFYSKNELFDIFDSPTGNLFPFCLQDRSNIQGFKHVERDGRGKKQRADLLIVLAGIT